MGARYGHVAGNDRGDEHCRQRSFMGLARPCGGQCQPQNQGEQSFKSTARLRDCLRRYASIERNQSGIRSASGLRQRQWTRCHYYRCGLLRRCWLADCNSDINRRRRDSDRRFDLRQWDLGSRKHQRYADGAKFCGQWRDLLDAALRYCGQPNRYDYGEISRDSHNDALLR